MEVNFGKYGKRVSYGCFTQHPIEEVQDILVLGILNFEPRQMGPVTSEVLILGVHYSKAESEKAKFMSPVVEANYFKLSYSPSNCHSGQYPPISGKRQKSHCPRSYVSNFLEPTSF
jgi:tRNA-binding EMAP/Myf-like protein